MSENRNSPRLKFAFLGLAGLLALGGGVLSLNAPNPELRAASGPQPLNLHSHLVAERLFRRTTEIAGLLEARKRVELFAESEGKIIEVGAEELDRVEEGQLLLKMDPLLAELEVTQADANSSRARSELRLAAANLERQSSLRGNSVASEAAYDAAVNNESVAKAAVTEARARRARAKDSLAKKTMTAPFSGELRLFPVMVGEYVRGGERVGELLDVAKLRIEIGLSDREIVAINVGADAGLAVEARPGETFKGNIRRAGGAPDSDSRKFPVQIEIDNAEGRLLPGMVARVQLDLGAPEMKIAIPREAVASEFGVNSVFVIAKDEAGDWRATHRRIELREIPFNPVEVEILSGVVLGERIALSGLHQLADETLVSFRADDLETGPKQIVHRESDTRSNAPPNHTGEGG